MTHQERAEAVVNRICGGELAAVEHPFALAKEIVWHALVAACNEELARRREVEASADRAVRIQSALEVRNAQLEGWLKGLDAALPLPEGGQVTGPVKWDIAQARRILDEFLCAEPRI